MSLKNEKKRLLPLKALGPQPPPSPHRFRDISLLGLYLVEAMCVEDLTDYLRVGLDDLESQVVPEGSWM